MPKLLQILAPAHQGEVDGVFPMPHSRKLRFTKAKLPHDPSRPCQSLWSRTVLDQQDRRLVQYVFGRAF